MGHSSGARPIDHHHHNHQYDSKQIDSNRSNSIEQLVANPIQFNSIGSNPISIQPNSIPFNAEHTIQSNLSICCHLKANRRRRSQVTSACARGIDGQSLYDDVRSTQAPLYALWVFFYYARAAMGNKFFKRFLNGAPVL